MRRPLIAGNWKMNLNRAEAIALVNQICAASMEAVDVLVCPPFVYLDAVVKTANNSSVQIGAQDCYFENSGAFTGEISAAMIDDLGCSHVILGHSERRNVMGETDDVINRKLHAVLETGLTPIVCVGELLEQREAGQTEAVISAQFEGSLAGLTADQMQKTIIAYEPVWAIGTGKTATPEQAQEVHADLRKMMVRHYNQQTSEVVRILYGGSVKPANAAELMSQADIDGALVGGASLVADSFVAIINAAGVVNAT